MMASHKLIIRSRDGTKRGELAGTSAGGARGGFLSLACTVRVNAPGLLVFTLNADNAAIDTLEIDGQVEYWRDKQMLLRGLYQGPQYATDENDQEIMTATCAGEKHLLSRAAVMWPAKTINRTLFTNARAETIAKTLATYNLTPEATVANGRLVDNPMTRISVEPDLGRGNEIPSVEVAPGTSLLEALQQVATVGGIDFDLVKSEPMAWEFRVYPGQVGVDRTTTVLFTRQRRNMGRVTYDAVRTDEVNVLVAGGEGISDSRLYTARYGPEYSTSQHREGFLSATSESGLVGLQAAVDQELENLRIRPKLEFEVLQSSSTRFGVQYNVGDLVSARYREIQAVYQVASATITLDSSQQEQIAVELTQR